MRIAYKLDENPEYCWVDLALWAMFGNCKLKDCKEPCEIDSTGTCYCGKRSGEATKRWNDEDNIT